jgi:hypothetical protein
VDLDYIMTVSYDSASQSPVSDLDGQCSITGQASLCEMCSGQSGTGTGFSPEYFGFALSVSFHHCTILKRRCIILPVDTVFDKTVNKVESVAVSGAVAHCKNSQQVV